MPRESFGGISDACARAHVREQRMSLIIFNRSLNDDGDGDQEEAVEISLYNDVIYRDAISHDG